MLVRPLRSGRAAGQTRSVGQRGRPVEVHPAARGRGQGQIRDLQTASEGTVITTPAGSSTDLFTSLCILVDSSDISLSRHLTAWSC